MLAQHEFAQHQLAGYTRIPLMLELSADLETPLSVYLKLCGANSRYSFLLESVLGGERFGRFSFIGLPARKWLAASGFGAAARARFYAGALVKELEGNPLVVIS